MHKTIGLLLIFSCLLNACKDQNKNATLIQGKWKGTEWLVNGKPSGHHAESLLFDFTDPKKYTMSYEDSKEEGTYKVENDMLFTTAQGKMEIMVKIEKLAGDSMVFRMNNSGQDELLTLLKVK